MDLRLLLLMLWGTLLGSVAQLFLKQGAVGVQAAGLLQFLLRVAISPRVLLGLGLYGSNMLLWLVVLRRYPLSMAYPLTALMYIEVQALCTLVLKEPFGWMQWVGILLILAGIWLVVSR